MTPEERFQQIENLLRAMIGQQASHDEAIARHKEAIARHDEAFRRHEEAVERNDAQIEKQNTGIQDLIRVSRTLLDSQTKAWEVIQVMSDRIDKLTENVNRFVAGLQKPNGSH